MNALRFVLASTLFTTVALAGEPAPPLSLEEAQRALAQSGVQVEPDLLKRVLPAMDEAVKKRLELEEAVKQAPHALALALDRRANDEPRIANAIAELVRDAGLRHVVASSDASWKLLVIDGPAPSGWDRLDFNDRAWKSAVPQGRLGALPWQPVAGFASPSKAEWIWSYASQNQHDTQTVLFRKRFVPPAETATLFITADNAYEVFLDGQLVGRGDNWQQATSFKLSATAGKPHLLAVKVVNTGGPGGLLVDVR